MAPCVLCQRTLMQGTCTTPCCPPTDGPAILIRRYRERAQPLTKPQRLMPLYASTIFLSAFLLFLVQPVIARQILPWFGGSAVVWATCLVFFQSLLLAGYAYSDTVIRRLSPRIQLLVHCVL